MEKKVFVRDLTVREEIESLFLVKHIAVMEARDGRKYLNVILSDASGDIEARKWHGAEEAFQLVQRGNYVNVVGKVNAFQNRLQLIVSDMVKVDSSDIQEKDFIASSQSEPDKMFDQLVGHVERLDDVYIKDLLKLFLFDPETQRRMKRWSAAKTIHHAYHGGLLEHVLSCVELGIMLANHYKANVNYVVAGAILHDLAKIYELSDGPIFDYTEEGKLVGHLGKGLELIDRFSAKLTHFPHDMKLHLKHIVLSHHGEYEYGSPTYPMTIEAYLVHYVDLIDSKLNTLLDIKRNDLTPGHWSAYIKHMDRVLFKADLPHYTDYESSSVQNTEPDLREQKAGRGERRDTPLKQSLADKLQGFKIED